LRVKGLRVNQTVSCFDVLMILSESSNDKYQVQADKTSIRSLAVRCSQYPS